MSDRQTEIQARANAMPCGCDAAGAPPTTARWADIRWLLAELSRVQQACEALTRQRNEAVEAQCLMSESLSRVQQERDEALRERDDRRDAAIWLDGEIRHYHARASGAFETIKSLTQEIATLTATVSDRDAENASLRAAVDLAVAAEREGVQEIATLRQQIGDVAERLAGLQEGDSRSPDWYHAASIAEEWVRALLQKGQ